jgi:hypothetical protein
MKHVWILAAAAACGGAPSKATTAGGDNDSVGGGVPPLFAALFVDGKRFIYNVEITTSHWDESDPKADPDGNVTDTTTASMTCTVRGMQNFTSAVAVKLECDTTDDIAPTGVYVATPDGLWRLDAFPMDDAAIATLPASDMVLPASPRAKEDSTEDPGGEGGSMVAIQERDGGWCRTESSWSGDEAGTSVCFATGKGLVGGSSWWAGGSTKDIKYTLVR